MSSCARHNPIDFSSSNTFFSSLNEKEIVKNENKTNTSENKSLEKNNIEKIEKQIIKKPILLTLSSYEKQLKEKIGFDEFKILKIFNEPNLQIIHGKVKNLQFHLQFCHLDLFFLGKDKTYTFKHYDIRPSSILSNLNEEKCVKELNKKFILIHGLK